MVTHRPSIRSANWLYLISMVSIISLGSWLQSRSLGWGLLATEFVLILLPVLLLIRVGRFDARAVLRLRWPGLGLVLLAFVIGAGIWGLDIGVQAVASALLGYAPESAIASMPGAPLNLLLFALAIMVAAPVCEEAFFRGYLLSAYHPYRPLTRVLIVAVLFACFHLQFQGLFALLPIALLLSYIAQRSGSLTASIAAHMGNNVMAGLLAIGLRLNPTLSSSQALPVLLCSLMVIGPLAALAALWWFHRRTARLVGAPAQPELPMVPATPPPSAPRRGAFWPLAGAGALYVVLATSEVIMGRFPQALAQSTLQLQPAPWTQPVHLAYRLFNVANERVGDMACTLTPQAQSIAFDCATQQRHFEAHQGASLFAAGQYVLNQSGHWDATSMRLLSAHLDFRGEFSAWTADVGDGSAGLRLTQAQNTVDLPADVVVAAEWPVRLMALPFGQRFYFGSRLNLLQLAAGQETGEVETAAVLVSGQEDLLTPPAGHAQVWKVTLGRQTAWYATAAPHTLLRYNDGYGVTWIITPPPDSLDD